MSERDWDQSCKQIPPWDPVMESREDYLTRVEKYLDVIVKQLKSLEVEDGDQAL